MGSAQGGMPPFRIVNDTGFLYTTFRDLERGDALIRPPDHRSDATRRIAEAFVAARLAGRSLPAYPGELPRDLDTAYACQDHAIELWPDALAGWKVGWITPRLQSVYGEERLVGPVFSRLVQDARPGDEVEFPVFVGGFAAVEAEFVFRLAADAPPDRTEWSLDEAATLVAGLNIGIEPASSPLATINELGPTAVISDFGNNAGLLLGPDVPDWRQRLANGMTCETFIEDQSVGRGGTARLPGGPLGALAFALARCARRGRPLRAGDLVTTGAASGIHDILPGQRARLMFDGVAELHCRAIPAAAAANGSASPAGQRPAC